VPDPAIGPTELAIAGADRRSITVCVGPTPWPYPQASGSGAAWRRHAPIARRVGPGGQYRGAAEERQSHLGTYGGLLIRPDDEFEDFVTELTHRLTGGLFCSQSDDGVDVGGVEVEQAASTKEDRQAVKVVGEPALLEGLLDCLEYRKDVSHQPVDLSRGGVAPVGGSCCWGALNSATP
jgi:hypothetical protein